MIRNHVMSKEKEIIDRIKYINWCNNCGNKINIQKWCNIKYVNSWVDAKVQYVVI